jgi:polyisoprenoid-binding protein YceI
MFRRTSVAAAAILLTTFALGADARWNCVEKGRIKVEAVAKPALGAFSGESKDVDAKEEGDKVIFTSDLKKLDMGLRKNHTKEAFEIDKHPKVKLTIEKSKLKVPADKEKVSGEVTGKLALHGVEKPVKVSYTVSRTGSDFHIKEAKFSFNYTNFNVEKICKVGVCVEPNVTVTVSNVKLRDKG